MFINEEAEISMLSEEFYILESWLLSPICE